jgi:hypothetical protein
MVVVVRVLTEPRLLADLIARGLESPSLRAWRPGDPAPTVTIGGVDLPASDRTQITILLPRQLDEPLSIFVDGTARELSPTRPHQLHDLILDLVGGVGSSND